MEQPQPPPPQDWREAFFTPVDEPLDEEHSLFENVEEFKLAGCSLEELSSKEDMSWESFYTFLDLPNENGQHLIVSVAPGVFLSASRDPAVSAYLLSSCGEAAYLLIQLKTGRTIYIWTAAEQATAISSCDFLFGLLAGADQPDALVFAAFDDGVSPCPVSGHAIENFLTKSNDNLTRLHFCKCIIEEGHFQGFSNAPVKEGVHIGLGSQCVIGVSAAKPFLDCTQKGRGPNYLGNCVVDPIVLGQALTTSNRITTLAIGKLGLGDSSFRAIVRAVAENKSLLEFDVQGMYISDNSWAVFCKSFRPHPTIKSLKLGLSRLPHGVSNPQTPAERIERRMNDILSMLHVNSVLMDVFLLDDVSGAPPTIPQSLREKVETRLAMNRSAFEEQCHSLGPLAPDVRPKLLGRALHMARLHPQLVWKFLSEHLDVVVETADARIYSNLDETAQKKRKQADLNDSRKRLKRLSRDGSS